MGAEPGDVLICAYQNSADSRRIPWPLTNADARATTPTFTPTDSTPSTATALSPPSAESPPSSPPPSQQPCCPFALAVVVGPQVGDQAAEQDLLSQRYR
jgi:hypothetical protein